MVRSVILGEVEPTDCNDWDCTLAGLMANLFESEHVVFDNREW